jgi:hypothetical protein
LFLVVAVVAIVSAANIWLVTERDVAYRNQHPSSQACQDQRMFAGLLAHEEYADVKKGVILLTGEHKAAAASARVRNALGCVLQEHVIPAPPGERWPNGKPVADLRYYLSFVEVSEHGELYPLMLDGKEAGQPPLTQLDALKQHFSQLAAEHKSNYVIAFVHGWRHDARVGDSNVADLRIYAGHVAAFLAERCYATNRYCDTVVTAVYVGWRGAQLDDTWLRYKLDLPIAGDLTRLAAIPSLFDRRAVAERIAPAVVGLLHTIIAELGFASGRSEKQTPNRMITLAHSLGGHVLIIGLKQQLLDLIQKQDAKEILRPPIGDLIVLYNPASEAANWTSVQKAVLAHKSLLHGRTEQCCLTGGAQRAFSVDQPPVLLSVTSARTRPAGGLRDEDCKRLLNGGTKYRKLSRLIRHHRGEYIADMRYDWATHDLFPASMGDLHPAAETLDWLAFDFEGRGELGHDCLTRRQPHFSLAGFSLHALANIMRILPFQNPDLERTRTIGHLDPQRPAFNFLTDASAESPFPFGTTHEMEIEGPDFAKKYDAERRASYRDLSDPHYSDCADVTGWLVEARERKRQTNETGDAWNSNVHGDGPALTPIESALFHDSVSLTAQFRHGLMDSGMRPISDANDPFWNIRAQDSVLSGHNGFVTTPLICAINQLVLDDIVAHPQHVNSND